MMKAWFCLLASLFILNTHKLAATEKSAADYANYRIHGLSAFTKDQQLMLKAWLKSGVEAQRAAFGVYPFKLEFYLYPKQSNQPVPWAYTRRDKQQSIHLYVDSRFELQKFIDDWTLYHELSHLALPYLGEKYSWFSEGFASFMQYQLMLQNGTLKFTPQQGYERKLKPHLSWYNTSLPPAIMASRLMSQKKYPAAYWGGAWYFIQANEQLQQQHQLSLLQLIVQYQLCCRANDHNMQQLQDSLQKLIGDNTFSNLLNSFEQQPGRELFPRDFPEANH
jgi:hypothetical protein